MYGTHIFDNRIFARKWLHKNCLRSVSCEFSVYSARTIHWNYYYYYKSVPVQLVFPVLNLTVSDNADATELIGTSFMSWNRAPCGINNSWAPRRQGGYPREYYRRQASRVGRWKYRGADNIVVASKCYSQRYPHVSRRNNTRRRRFHPYTFYLRCLCGEDVIVACNLSITQQHRRPIFGKRVG